MLAWSWIVVAAATTWLGVGLALTIGFARFAAKSRLELVLYCVVGAFVAPLLVPVFNYLSRRDDAPKAWDVFLSYSHWNCLWASALFAVTRFSGGEVFLDYVVIQRGQGWRGIAEKGIAQSDIFVFLDTCDAREAPNVQHEVRYRRTTYPRTSGGWRDKRVLQSTFPSDVAKGGSWFQRKTGIIVLAVPESPHASEKYKTPSGAASESIANIEGWLSVNLPAVEMLASQLGLPCPPRQILDPLMRQYLEWVAGTRKIPRLSDEARLNRGVAESASSGDLDRVLAYVEDGADITSRDATALILASGNGHLRVVRELLALGAQLENTASQGRTALIFAIRGGHTEVALLLVRAGASPDHADQQGKTPLMWAVDMGDVELVRELVDRGATIDAKDLNGQTALYRARKARNIAVQEILEVACGSE
jgi:Ankyrin repeats (3 copies)/Ankyrin repeats (many copies)